MESSKASMAKVIGDDDLLREILLCLGFPAFLVRAALVSKRWLGLAADRAFLRRFRDRNPPQLIGFYINDFLCSHPRFLRVSEAPELRSAASRAGFYDGDPFLGVVDCHNGRLLLKLGAFTYGGHVTRNLLCPTRAMDPVRPPSVSLPSTDRFNLGLNGYSQHSIFLSRDGSDGIVYVAQLLLGRKLSVEVCVRHPSGAWGQRILPAVELPALPNPVMDITMPIHGKLYMVTDTGYIHCLDFVAPRPHFFSMKLPGEVGKNFKLSYGDDTGLVLIHGEGFQLSVWHRQTDDSGEDSWKLVDRFRVLAAHDRGEEILVVGASDEAEFVFLWLQTSGAIVCVNLRIKQETIYELMVRSKGSITVFPFMTVWPPVFPALAYEDERDK